MGREIRRVALDFDYPINGMIWKGYFNPYSGMKCEICDGSGSAPEYKKLCDAWYDAENGYRNGWSKNITQDEVQALVDADRLWEFTRRPRNTEQQELLDKRKAEGTGGYWLPDDNGYVPTAAEVNEWSMDGMGHDVINRIICVQARADRLGIKEEDRHCPVCGGEGMLWPDPKFSDLCENFEYTGPPAGEGYQLWSTTTEGTPMSPVFADPEELAHWLEDNKASTFGYDTADYETWLKFILGPGWALSCVAGGGKGVRSGVEASVERGRNENSDEL